MTLLIALVPLFPLLGFIILGLGFKSIPKRIASVLGPGTIGISFLISLIILFNTHNFTNPQFHHLFTWLSFGRFYVPLDFLIDPLSILMLLIVTGVGFIIHIYSIGYMKHDEGFNRFFAYLNLFIFFMLILVMGANYVVMFIGWEGVGLCSYLLIGFWYRNQSFNNAAKKAFIMNRIGDLGFLLGIFLIFNTFQSFNYSTVFEMAKHMQAGNGTLVAITLLLFIGAVGKSAQIPLYTWLPDAMAGPTPVSALIHAATMVTAGVYMVARSGVLYVLAPATMEIMGITALVTMLMAAAIAIFQNDIKKILAYSTISQLGYMFLALSVGAFSGAIFHLTTHAFFKALLFLAAGSVIHALDGEQDIRNMGGLKHALPKTYRTFLIGTLAIAGLPPFSGFFSKDGILSEVFNSGLIAWIIAIAVSMMTAFYMFRLLYLAFSGDFRGSEEQKKYIHESPAVMTIPLMILAFLSFFGGFINIPDIMGSSGILNNFLAPVFADARQLRLISHHHVSAALEWSNMAVMVLLVLLMAWAAYKKFVREPIHEEPETGLPAFFHKLLTNKFYIDELYDTMLVKPALRISDFLHKFVELKFIDRLVDGTGTLVIRFSNAIRYLQAGHVGVYMFFMILGILLILFFNIIL